MQEKSSATFGDSIPVNQIPLMTSICFGMGCCSDDSIPTRLHKAKNVVYSMLENSMLFPTR